MTGSIRIFEKLNFTPKSSAFCFSQGQTSKYDRLAHSSVQIIIQSSEDNPVLGNTLVSVSDGTALLSFYCDRNCE